MTYDLTSFLTTIAAASASIVAILGGFIASKLISLSSERSAAIERLKQITEELDVRTSEKNRIQAENDADDAFDFVREHITALMSNESLDAIYDESERPVLQKSVLSDYWDKAKNVFALYCSAAKEKGFRLNDDHVPMTLARDYTDDDFCYSVCREIGSEFERQQKAAERAKKKAQDSLGLSFDYPDISEIMTKQVTPGGYWYSKNAERIDEQKSAITILELQKEQTEKQLRSLKKPKGMWLGLCIFAVFSILCIILPLAFTPFSTEDVYYYLLVKTVFIALFSLGLIAIFLYLVYLLRWDDRDK
ncbi:MAG: hypothetical protein LUI12_00160 [Clostridiales bacterium]|nr:hypothetical protein [Clostridiales bacterium]